MADNENIVMAVPKRTRGKMKQPDKNSLRQENKRLKAFAMAIGNLLKYEYPDVSKMLGFFDVTNSGNEINDTEKIE